MTNALLGYDTAYAIHDGQDPGAFQDIAEVMEITPPNEQSDDVEATHYKSPGKKREYIQGLTDPGEMTFGINWIPSDATDTIIQGLKASGEKRDHRITWPNGVTWTFNGYIKGFEPTAPIDDRMTATVTVRVSGSTTIA
ncbi:phage tail tube protein [Ruegeria sp. Ofav3-42]|uniref:phage tail tube protein n=1 Tax=Ruegeria sp. Ofav3-42 TaxID=2917759 RepID=UPI001EF46924|nr:phage tail tube protein [Ruegeria sp. Ofav3-42]MCG7520849.1 hypothetical protein [Ruegeria sp. Ofav3-42]